MRSANQVPRILSAALLTVAVLAAAGTASAPAVAAAPSGSSSGTATPIKHLVVIYQENVSFDHYFATYPHAANLPGERPFHAAADTPTVNGLDQTLLGDNPNAANPQRLGVDRALTCDQDHGYTAEQLAADHGLMDKFVENTGTGSGTDPLGRACLAAQVMDYYDGNTTTALWNYAQHFAMSDNSYGTTFGPSTPGALNLASGQTHGVTDTLVPAGSSLAGEIENGTVIGDPQPLGDDCSTRDQVRLSGRNVGDLLNDQQVTWGWFQGGFAPTTAFDPATGSKAVCGASHPIGAALGYTGQAGTKGDYIPHHEPFQYYASTANPHHLPPSSVAAIGHSDQANHQYDLTDFWAAAGHGSLPQVSFLKAAGYQDGHAFYSDPIDEQLFLVSTINRLEHLPQWRDTAVVIAYDDSDGWYDHVLGPIVNQSSAPADALTGAGACGSAKPGAYLDRCGYGPRLPLLVVSPFAKANAVDHAVTDQSSILRFIEDNWHLGRIGDQSFDAKAGSLQGLFDFRHGTNLRLFLNPLTGQRA